MTRRIILETYYNKGICVICNKVFYKAKPNSSKGKKKPAEVRPLNCVTCSKKCSRIAWSKR